MAKTARDPTQAANLWAQHMAAAGPQITAGVNAGTGSPGQLAAAQKNHWLAAVTSAADHWAAALHAMSLQTWQQAMITKGIPRIQQSAQQALPKVQAFLAAWIPFQHQVVAGLPARGGLEANIQRMESLVRSNAAAKGKFRQSSRSR